MNILRALDDPNLFRPFIRDPATYTAWRAWLAALFGLPMDEAMLAAYRARTGRNDPPTVEGDEAWLIVGRRGGKSFTMALLAVYLACFRDYRRYLAPGERATILVIAADRKQARVIVRYVRGMLTNIPLLRKLILSESAESFDLRNHVTIEVGTASFRSTRGYSFAAVLADEISFWRTNEDSANPDTEIIAAIRSGLATIPGSKLIAASSPYARRGELWNAYRRHWAKPDAPLVWRAASRDMNPTLPQRVIDEAMQRDPASAKAEYLAEWRNDIEAFVSLEVVENCIRTDLATRRPARNERVQYHAFVDPSGGASDSMTMAISHKDAHGVILVDHVVERPAPFAPNDVVRQFAHVLREYGISTVTGDRYAGLWPSDAFARLGITYRAAELSRSELYQEFLPILHNEAVDLLRAPKLVNQLVSLERRVSRGGCEIIDHPPGGHDDVGNAVAGAVHLAQRRARRPTMSIGPVKAY